MTCSELRDVLAGRFEGGFAERYGKIVAKSGLHDLCMDLAFDGDVRIAFRAAYALETAFWLNPTAFAQQYADRFVTDFLNVTNTSAHRHYTKMMSYMINNNLLQLTCEQCTRVAERSFDLLIDYSTRPAVKVWCMEILYSLSARADWIAEALYDTMQHQMQTASPALCSRGAKICKRLKSK